MGAYVTDCPDRTGEAGPAHGRYWRPHDFGEPL